MVTTIATLIFYLIGRYWIKISNRTNLDKISYLYYYNLSFWFSSFCTIVIHLLFILVDKTNGLGHTSEIANDAIFYIEYSETIFRSGIKGLNLVQFGGIGYSILLALLHALFGSKILIFKLLNSLLYALTIFNFGVISNKLLNKKKSKFVMLFLIFYLTFISYVTFPLKEVLVWFLVSNICMFYIINNKVSWQIIIFIVFLIITRIYIGIILLFSILIHSIFFSKSSIRNKIIVIIVFIVSLLTINFGSFFGFEIKTIFYDITIGVGKWNTDFTVTGMDKAVKSILSSDFDVFRLIIIEVQNILFNPLFTSIQPVSEFITFGNFVRMLLYYLGAISWYFLLPGVLYGLYIMCKNEQYRFITILIVVSFIFFVFFMNMLRYQLFLRFFLVLIGFLGFEFYRKWKLFIPIYIFFVCILVLLTI